MLKNNKKIKIAILEVSDQNKAVLEYYFSTAGKSFYQETSIDDADTFITDYDYPGAVEHWDEIAKTTHKPGIILSISEKQIPSAVWLAKPLSAKALTEAATQIDQMLTAEPPVVTAEVETSITETAESESLVTDLVEPETTTIEPVATAEVETASTEVESDSPVADLIEPNTSVTQPIFKQKVDEELSFEEMLIQDMSANQQPATEEQMAADTQEKSQKLNKKLSESFEKIFDDNEYQTEKTLVSEVTEAIEFESLAVVAAKEQQEKQQTPPDRKLAPENDAIEQLSVETITPDAQELKKQVVKAAEITEVSLENSTEASDEEKIDALLESLIQGEGRKKKPEATKTDTEKNSGNSIAGLSTEELTLELEQADATEKPKEVKKSTVDLNSLQLEETLLFSDLPKLEEPVAAQDSTPTEALKKVEDSLPSLKSKVVKNTKAAQNNQKIKAAQAAKKVKAAKTALAAQKVKVAKATLAANKIRLAKAAQTTKQNKAVKKLLIEEDSVRVEDSEVAEENTFAETLEVKIPKTKNKPVKTDKSEPSSVSKMQKQNALENDLGPDLLDFDFNNLISDKTEAPKKTVVEDDGSQLNLIDARNVEKSDLEELVVNKEVAIENIPNQPDPSVDELLKSLRENPELNDDYEAPVTTQAAKKTAEQELQALLHEIRVEAEKASSGKKPASSKFTYGHNPTSQRSPSPDLKKTNAEKRWSMLCGENKDITSAQETKDISFTLNKHMLSVLLDQLDHAKSNSKQLLRLKYDDIIIVIDYAEDTIYCNYSVQSREFSDYCYRELKPEDVKIHDLDYSEVNLYRKKMMVEYEKTHSIESFVWTTSLLTSRGRLLEHTDITKRIGLKTWPNLTRLELIPHAMNVAAVLSKHPGSLEDIPKWLKIPQRYVFAFYNAALSLDMIELDSRNFKLSTFSFNPKTTPDKITKDRGFFGRLLKRLSA